VNVYVTEFVVPYVCSVVDAAEKETFPFITSGTPTYTSILVVRVMPEV